MDQLDKCIPFDWDKFRNSMTPVQRRSSDRHMKVWDKVYKLHKTFPWMQWPLIKLVYIFWNSIFEDGIKSTCAPRWGAITFSFLNDGYSPTLWHTWRQLIHDGSDKYTGIYTMGAPKSLKQAQEWEEKWSENK
jgi:hypothetical protein